MDNYYIALFDKETKRLSSKVPLRNVIYNQSEIEFEWGTFGEEDYATLPYNDFLFWNKDYDVVIEHD